mmetsp:Transcript_177028/g.567756  ORF Transcript_177028/g.567756 Transcript_177028/m.567756 type:complete len:276 (+) Transcript_177028:709-1536(+)
MVSAGPAELRTGLQGAKMDPATRPAGIRVNIHHSLNNVLKASPMRWVLKACNIKNKDRVALLMVATNRRKMPGPRLPQRLPRVANDDALPILAFARGPHSCPKRFSESLHFAAAFAQCCLIGCSLCDRVGSVTTREALEHVERQSNLPNLLGARATAQVLLVEPPPRTLPSPHRVYPQGVQDHGQSGQAAERWLVLCSELLREDEVILHGSREQCLSEKNSALVRSKWNLGGRQCPLVEAASISRAHCPQVWPFLRMCLTKHHRSDITGPRCQRR